MYDSRKQYAKAELLYQEALQIRKKALGEKHPDYANSLNNLGYLYMVRRRHADAEPLFLEAMRILKEALGEKHPKYADSLMSLALLYDDTTKPAKAEPLYRRALEITREHLKETAAVQSEADQIRYVATSRSSLNHYLAMPEAHADQLYEAVFRWHGAVTARQTLAGIGQPRHSRKPPHHR